MIFNHFVGIPNVAVLFMLVILSPIFWACSLITLYVISYKKNLLSVIVTHSNDWFIMFPDTLARVWHGAMNSTDYNYYIKAVFRKCFKLDEQSDNFLPQYCCSINSNSIYRL